MVLLFSVSVYAEESAGGLRMELSLGAGGGSYDFSQDVSAGDNDTTIRYSSFDMLLSLNFRAGWAMSALEFGGVAEMAIGNRSLSIDDENKSIFSSAQAQNNYLQYAGAGYIGINFSSKFRMAIEYYPILTQSIVYAEVKDENMHGKNDENKLTALGATFSYINGNWVYSLSYRQMTPVKIFVGDDKVTANDLDEVLIVQSQVLIGYRF